MARKKNEKAATAVLAPKRTRKRKPKITNAMLKKLAVKHKPPQSWYDADEVGLC
ncbi:MAG: hypothetical protein L0Y72_01310 [Gemmataceae bacterium]|nr:hypothetical protein [Gemmataceae bacterium]